MNKRYMPLLVLAPTAVYLTFYGALSVIHSENILFKSLFTSLFATVIYTAKFFAQRKAMKDDSVTSSGRTGSVFALVAVLLLVSLSGAYFVAPNDGEFILIFGAVVHSLLAFAAAGLTAEKRKIPHIFRDSASGQYYRYEQNGVAKLTESEANALNINRESNTIPSYSFDSISISSANYGTGNDNIVINPSSGLPMPGGISGLDIHGNSWGTSFNEPSSNTSYDPNRGY
ncbi:hypothetical protein ACR2R9_004033 [Cronobacter sakazakii]|uniref:hypothetical protein n=1 Tax=Cronobacter sakazakii TaxID=28141 RepID=UPI00294B0861|nr:hypothetical protein [Cronobacter sakazakii]ELY4230335.1 hypothetical protein [Cronobacter sakazakii]MDI7612266.1 hypothetical protein [Cronobacter sakazakii]MDI7616565.1 hypothetical protein [Cronobacter sakazakii]